MLFLEKVRGVVLKLDSFVQATFMGLETSGTKYLVIVLAVGGGFGCGFGCGFGGGFCGGFGGGFGGGGGGMFLLLPAKILEKFDFGFIVIFFLTHSFTPTLNFSSLGSFLRLTSSLLNKVTPLYRASQKKG